MESVAYAIGKILQTAGIGTIGTDLFMSKEPDSPDNCVTVYNTGGIPENCLSLDTSGDAERNDFQVRVRNIDYLAAYVVVDAIRAELDKAKFTVESGNDYAIWIDTLPVDLQRDTQNRVIVVTNYSCLRSPS